MNLPPRNVITSINPVSFLRSQIRDGTAQLEINGRNFDNGMNSVVFAGVGTIPCQTNTAKRLVVTVPANAITGEIRVDTRSIISLPVLLTIVEDVVAAHVLTPMQRRAAAVQSALKGEPVNVPPVNVPPVNVPPVNVPLMSPMQRRAAAVQAALKGEPVVAPVNHANTGSLIRPRIGRNEQEQEDRNAINEENDILQEIHNRETDEQMTRRLQEEENRANFLYDEEVARRFGQEGNNMPDPFFMEDPPLRQRGRRVSPPRRQQDARRRQNPENDFYKEMGDWNNEFVKMVSSHPVVRRTTDTVSRTYREVVSVSFHAPANLGREIVYFYAYLHLLFIVLYSIQRRDLILVMRGYFYGVRYLLNNPREFFSLILRPLFVILKCFQTSIRGESYTGVFLKDGYTVTFMVAIYLAYRFLKRGNRIQGGTKKKGSGNKESFEMEDLGLDLQDLSTKSETHISGTVKVGKSNLDENEILKFIKENLIKMNDKQYKMSLSGLDLIISIEGDNITFDTVFSDKEKFEKISKEIFEMNKSLYAEFGITEQDIHNKIDEFSKMNLELKMKSEMKSEMKSKKQGGKTIRNRKNKKGAKTRRS